MDFERLDLLAQQLMKERKAHLRREKGSVYYHGQRVRVGVMALRRRILPEDSSRDGVLQAAAMFHDLGKGIEPHAHYGAALARVALPGLVTPEELEQVCALIAAHCDRRPQEAAHDCYARLLQDADLLDHFGSYEVWMNFHYYAAEEGCFGDAAQFYQEHYRPFIQKHRALLNYPESVRIYDEKDAYMRTFIERLLVESTGGYCT